MSKLRSTGRMIRRDLAEDEGMARLSDGASRLYFHLLPWLDSWGKFSGGPGTISETVIPLLGWSRKRILSYLAEINLHTSMRVWTQNGRFCVHDERFFEKQDIREDRRGRDTLPSYPGADRMKPGTSPKSLPELLPDEVPPEVEVEVEVEFQREEEGEVELNPNRALPLPPSVGGGATAPQDRGNGKGASNGEIPESKMALIRKPKDEDHQKTLEALYGEVIRGSMSSRDAINQAVNMRCLKLPEAEQLFSIDGG